MPMEQLKNPWIDKITLAVPQTQDHVVEKKPSPKAQDHHIETLLQNLSPADRIKVEQLLRRQQPQASSQIPLSQKDAPQKNTQLDASPNPPTLDEAPSEPPLTQDEVKEIRVFSKWIKNLFRGVEDLFKGIQGKESS